MTRDAAPEDDTAPEQDSPPKSKKPARSGSSVALTLVSIAAIAAAAYEYRSTQQLTTALAQANAHNTQLQNETTNQAEQLKATTAKLEQLARRNLPISIIFRPAASGNGLTTFFKNNAPTPIEIAVVLSNPVTERRREVNLNLPANGLVSIGENDGWVFAPGHHILVTHAEFGTVDYVVPEKP